MGILVVGYSGREKALQPSIEVFKALIRDELRQKFKGNGDINKCRNGREPSDLPKSMEKRSNSTELYKLKSDSRHLASEAKLQ